jgi:hypothetical protein
MLTFKTYLEFTEKHKFVGREAEWNAVRAKFGKDNVYGVNGMFTPTSVQTNAKVDAKEKYWDKFMKCKDHKPGKIDS